MWWQAVALAASLLAAGALLWGLSLRRRLSAASGMAPEVDEPDPEASDGPLGALAEALQDRDRILETLTDAFFHLDARGRFTYLNPAGRRLLSRLDMEADDLMGRSIWSVFPTPEDAPGRRTLTGALEDRESRSHVTHHEDLEAWIEVRAFPARDGGVSVYVRDVTEQKETEAALRESRERFRTMVEHAPEAIFVLDVDAGRVVELNENAVELFGRSREELTTAMPYQFSPPRQPDGRTSLEAARDYVQRAVDGESLTFEWVHLTGDGRAIDTEVRLVRLPARNRTLVRGSVTDITNRKRAERALRESEERFRALFEEDVAGNFVTDVDGRLRACNPAFARIFGFDSVEQALGTDVHELYPSPAERQELLDALRENETVEYAEVEARRVDGSSLHLVENVRGVFDEDGELTELRGHLIDVTQEKRLEDQLQRAQKLEAVGRLAGGIAHDFNNLLTTVTGHADLVLMDQELPPSIRDDLRKIRRAAERAAKLTGQLLAFSRRQVLQPDLLDLNRVVEEVTEMLARVIGEDVEIRIETDDDLLKVEADAGQLEQVVMNLALNARDAMPEGGTLVLATGNQEVGAGAEGVDGELPPGRYAYLEVRDTGHGIPRDARDKIFEPFYTTKEPGKGTGLGLAMVYGIVTQSGGHMTVESEVGRGTTFRTLLPAALVDDAGASEGTLEPVEETTTILVFLDDPVVRKLVRRILRRDGHSVLEAETRDDAVAFLREWRGAIHLLVTDGSLNGDDVDLVSLLERERPDARLLRTLSEAPDGGTPGTERPDRSVLRTPFSPRDLTRRVHALLGTTGPGEPARGARG